MSFETSRRQNTFYSTWYPHRYVLDKRASKELEKVHCHTCRRSVPLLFSLAGPWSTARRSLATAMLITSLAVEGGEEKMAPMTSREEFCHKKQPHYEGPGALGKELPGCHDGSFPTVCHVLWLEVHPEV